MNHSARRADQTTAWITRMQAATPTENDHAEFEAWLGSDPSHANEYAKALQTWRDLTIMRHSPQFSRLLGQPTWRERLVEAWRIPRTPVAVAGAAAAALVAGVALYWPHRATTPLPNDHFKTGIAQVQDFTLSDGTQLTFGPKSSAYARYNGSERILILVEGEAYFDVAREPGRPFKVIAADKAITALGTAFEVKLDGRSLKVAVADGKVAIDDEATSSRVILSAGQQASARIDGVIEAPRSMTAQQPASWRSGRLVYDDVELSEVVADANRYIGNRIILGDPKLGHVRVTTSFRASQVDGLIETLEEALPITVERAGDGDIVLHSRAAK